MTTTYEYRRRLNGDLFLVPLDPLIPQDPNDIFNPVLNNIDTKELCLIDEQDPSKKICIKAEDPVTSDYNLCLPKDEPASGDILEVSGISPDFTSFWTPFAAGAGFVQTSDVSVGNTQIPVYDGITGNIIKTTSAVIDGSGNMSGIGDLDADNITGIFDITTPILTLDAGSFATNINRPNSGISHTLSLPSTLLGSDQLLQFDNSGIGSYILKSSFLTNPLTSDLETAGFSIENNTSTMQIVQNVNDTFTLANLSGKMILQGAEIASASAILIRSTDLVSGIETSSGSLGLNMHSTGLNQLSSSSNDSFANQIHSTNGGIRLLSAKPIVLTSTSTSGINDIHIDSQGIGAQILLEADEYRNLITGNNSDSFLIDCSGGADMNFTLDCKIDSDADIDLTATDIIITASSNSNPKAIELLNVGTNAGIFLSSTGVNPISLNLSEFDSDGNLIIKTNESIFLNNGIVSFGDGSFGTSLLNHLSPTQNVTIRMPNNTAAVNDVLVVNDITTTKNLEFNDIPTILNDGTLILRNVSVHEGLQAGIEWTRSSGKRIRLTPPTTILNDISLEMPSSPPAISPGEFSALVSNDNNVLSFSNDISYVVNIKTPVTAVINDIAVFSNVSQYSAEINTSGESIESLKYSSMITGALPNILSNLVKISANDGDDFFSISQSGDILLRDATDPSNIVFTKKNVQTFTPIPCTLLGDPLVNNIFIYVDARSDPILIGDIIQKIDGPGSREDYEVYLGTLDFRDELGMNDVIENSDNFTNTAYSSTATLNILQYAKNRNLSGCVFGDTGAATLAYTHTNGEAIRMGAGAISDISKPDHVLTSAIALTKYHYINTAGNVIISTVVGTLTLTNQWNNAGSLVSVNGSKYYISYFYKFYGSDNTRFAYSTQEFGTLDDARNNVNSFGPNLADPNLKDGILRGAYVFNGNSSDNTNSSDVVFIEL